MYILLLALISSVSLTSCSFQQEEDGQPVITDFAATGNILYLHDLVKKYNSAEDAFTSITRSGNVVVDFYADWCGPCRNLGQTIERVASSFNNVTFLKVDIDQFPEIAQRFNIRSIPVLCLFKNGSKVKQVVGQKSMSELDGLFKSTF